MPCWLVNHLVKQIEIVSFASRAVRARRVFVPDERLVSDVLPTFAERPSDLLPQP